MRFDPEAPLPPEVPWLRRREIGGVAAYCRTVWLVVFWPHRLAEQAWRATQAHEAEAESFRRITALLAAGSLALCAGAGASLEFPNTAQAIRQGAATFCMTALPSLVFFWLCTLPTPQDEPRTVADASRTRQLEPLRRFCCAAIGLIPVFALMFMMTVLLQRVTRGNFSDARILIVGLALVVIPIAWWRVATTYLTHGGRTGWFLFTMSAWATFWMVGAVVAAIFTGMLIVLLRNFLGF